jgi:2,4-dienoyl-CoA reductase-like NADH-dependent reductase (Old Yellow Enzyme family)/thioredoxin reductase
MERFQKILEPITIKNVTIRNRIVMPAMNTNMASNDGFATMQLTDYYAERAKGGVGLIIVSAAAIDKNARKRTGGLLLDKDAYKEDLRILVEEIHAHGAMVFQQLNHNGRLLSSMSSGTFRIRPVAPSPIPHPVTGEIPKELTQEEILDLIEKFGNAALRAKDAGFDGVELHGAHGYLLNQFLSPHTNKRCDKYGGNFEGRQRFPLEVLQNVRKMVGEDFPLSYRLSAEEFIPGGLTIEETEVFCSSLAKAGVDLIHVSAGINESPSTELKVIPMMDTPRGCYLPLAERIKKRVNIPVIAVARINSPQMAEQALVEKKADLIAVGRGLIADPDWVQKAAAGQDGEIRTCIACNQGCMERLIKEEKITCIYNPDVGREREYRIVKTGVPKKVLIVGGGPGGMEAARVLSLRGHHVTLWEQGDRLGGQVLLYAGFPGKEEFWGMLDYFTLQLKKCEVSIELNKVATSGNVRAFNPQTVILATGAKPRILALPGIDQAHVFTFKEVLNKRNNPEKAIVVVGGGLVGLETALYLSQQNHQVTVVEILAEIASDAGPLVKANLLQKIRKSGITTMTNCELLGIRPTSLDTKQNGAIQEIKNIGAVVLACGSVPNDDLFKALDKSGIKLCRVGDCVSPRRCLEATHEAAAVARMI